MDKISASDDSLVVRTDFTDEAGWKSLCEKIQEPVGEFQALVAFVSDPQYEGLTVEQLVDLAPEDSEHAFLFVVDKLALTDPDHPVLVVDLLDEPGQFFRVIPSEMWSVENNLSIANMDFEEFAEAVDQNGVFRGFS